MKKILTILLILLISQVCFAGRVQQAHKAVIAAKNGAAPSASCPADGAYDLQSNNSTTHFLVVSGGADFFYCGGYYQPNANHDICKIGVRVTEVAGDISGESYILKIWLGDGNLPASPITNGTSVTKATTGNESDTWLYFTFTTPPSVAQDTVYSITIENAGGLETTNTLGIDDEMTVTDELYGMYTWRADGTQIGGWPTYTNAIEVYYYD